MTYKSFEYQNNRLKESGRVAAVTIDRTLYMRNMCFLSSGEVIAIDCLVSFITGGQFCVTNPSKISRWKGFRK